MIGYIMLCLVCVGIVVVGVQCIHLSRQQSTLLKSIVAQDQSLSRLDYTLKSIFAAQENMSKRISQLSTDVLKKEIYQSADNRHALAIDSARHGKTFIELMQLHGLSSDEATLIIALHGPKIREVSNVAHKNANLVDPSRAELV